MFSGCGAAWLARYLGVVEVAGSNPVSPTRSASSDDIRRALFSALFAKPLSLSGCWVVRCLPRIVLGVAGKTVKGTHPSRAVAICIGGFALSHLDNQAGVLSRLMARLRAVGSEKELGLGAMLSVFIHGLVILGASLSNTFVGVYMWRLQQSFAPIAIFYLLHYVGIPVGFVLGGILADQKERTHSLRIGIVLHGVFFASVLLLRSRSIHFVGPLGVLFGLGVGFYYLANGVLAYDLTDDGSIDYFTGMMGLVGGVGSTTAPLVAGYLISMWPNRFGYNIVFLASVVIFVVAALLSLKFYGQKGTSTFAPFALLRQLRGTRWMLVMWVHFFAGLRGGPLAFLVGILVFRLAKGELGLGLFAFASGLFGLASAYVAGRTIGKHNRGRTYGYGVGALAVSTLILAFAQQHIWGLVAFGLIEAIFNPWFGIPFNAFQFSIMDHDRDIGKNRAEYITAREIPLNIGRLVSTGIFLYIALVPGVSSVTLNLYLIGLTAAHLVVWPILGKAMSAEAAAQ